MTTSSLNLYATKVFGEHPVSLWALDDTSDYIPLISRSDQNLNNWAVSGASVVNAVTDSSFQSDRPPLAPFDNLYVSGLNEIQGSSGIVTMESPNTFQSSDFDLTMGSFAISSYFFTYDRTVEVRLGYSYLNKNSEEVEVIRSVSVPPERQWASVSQTFTFPESFSDLKFIIEVSFQETSTQYQFAVNGINVGQWAEDYFLESPGVLPSSISSQTGISALGVEALPYGLEGSSGYYLADSNRVYARNSGLPMVYGAYNSTVLFPFDNNPSLVVPGFGFLNESGKSQKLTFEFWAKIQNRSFTPKRILGPLGSDDGLYVEGAFLKLKINNLAGAHYVREWDRPMLINIRYSSENVSMVVNGEEVVSLDTSRETLTFPNPISDTGINQDWLGFYAYEEVPIIQLDSVGIYPYIVPAIVSKRRFAFGQAVDLPINDRGLKTSNSLFFDSSFSQNTKNYSYPNLGRWNSAIVENLIPDPDSIKTPDYDLPKIFFNNKTTQQWLDDVSDSQVLNYSFFSLEPNETWEETDGYLFFESLNNSIEETKGFYGVFSLKRLYEEDQILFQMQNSLTGESFTSYLNNDEIRYVLKTKNFDGSFSEDVVFSASGLVADAIFLAGIHIPRARSSLGFKLSRFFANKQNIKVFVAGNAELNKTFRGRVHSVGFSNKRNLEKIESEFLLTGFPVNFSENYAEIVIYDGGLYDTTTWEEEYNSGLYNQEEDVVDIVLNKGASAALLLATNAYLHVATYTLIPKDFFGIFTLDIGVESYWEDYLPLSYFAKYVDDAAGKSYKELDFLHFNIDYPNFNKYDNDLYDSSQSPVKTYVSFKYLFEGSSVSGGQITSTQQLNQVGIVRPDASWKTTRYEVVDDTIIYPPSDENFENLAIIFQVEFSVPGIKSNPIQISSMNISSKALGYSPNKIGNLYGADLFPYQTFGIYNEYKDVAPFSIYKNSAPYLYLAGGSGIRIRDEYLTSENRGISMPVNKNSNSFFKVGAVQMLIKYEKDTFPNTPVKIFEIESKNKTTNFYLISYGGTSSRGYIYALDSQTGRPEANVSYVLDGKRVKRPILTSNVWSSVGLGFEEPLDLGQFVGAIRITNPIFVSNISYYQITQEDEATSLAYRKWYAVRSEPDNELDWDYWDEFTWQEVLFLTEARPTTIDPSTIYQKYTGTDRLVNQSGSSLTFGNYKYSTFKDIRWTRITLDSA